MIEIKSIKSSFLAGTLFLFLGTASAANAQEVLNTNVTIGAELFVTTQKLNIRATPSKTGDLKGTLNLNDKVKVLNAQTGKIFALIQVQKSNSASGTGYVSSEYLSPEAVVVENAGKPSRYFMVQNLATERARVYERCTAYSGCPHRMIMETEFVAGRTEGPKDNKQKFMTRLGRYKITEWVKFYEDNQQHYPSWYDPTYPALPKVGSDGWVTNADKYVPNPEVNVYRGAFGWWAAMVSPNADSQWVHGTFGWGADKDAMIKRTRGFLVNLISDPRSSGCTRLENRAVAYLRSKLPVGTEVYRVYAMEAYYDSTLANYQSQKDGEIFNWILTKENVRQSNAPSSEASAVMSRNVPQEQILESGDYQVDQLPTAYGFQKRPKRSGMSGNSYGIDKKDFKGYFLVDEGKFAGYEEPPTLPKGGMSDRSLPQDLISDGLSIQLPGKN